MIEVGAMYMGGAASPKEFGQAIEATGFDSLWAGDHILHYVDGIATLGIFAGATNKIPLGTSVIVAPFRPGAVIAKAVLTASWAAKRQITVGIGPGGDVPLEFAVVGNDVKVRGAWTNEAIEIMQLFWGAKGQPVSYEGRFAKFQNAVMDRGGNHTYDGPAPRIWAGGRSEASLKRTVKYASGYLPYLIDPRQLKERVARLKQLCDEADRDFSQLTIAVTTFMVPGSSIDEAAAAAGARGGFQNVDNERLKRFYALGSVADCMNRIEEYVEAGATTVVLGCAPAYGGAEQLQRFLAHADEIVPRARRLAA